MQVGEDKDAKAKVETRRAYHANYKAVLAKLEESVEDAKERIGSGADSSTVSSMLHKREARLHRWEQSHTFQIGLTRP